MSWCCATSLWGYELVIYSMRGIVTFPLIIYLNGSCSTAVGVCESVRSVLNGICQCTPLDFSLKGVFWKIPRDPRSWRCPMLTSLASPVYLFGLWVQSSCKDDFFIKSFFLLFLIELWANCTTLCPGKVREIRRQTGSWKKRRQTDDQAF